MSTPCPNYAGQTGPELDQALIDELDLAGIAHDKFPESMRERRGEVKSIVLGVLHGWSFERFWTYWVCKGPGIPLDAATKLHKTHGRVVRVNGHCGCPSPLEQFQGLGTGSYHVDTIDGLRALADTIKEVVAMATRSLAPKIPVYAVDLSGSEDHYTFLVTKEVFDWINAGCDTLPEENRQQLKKEHSTLDPTTPQSIQDEITKEMEQSAGGHAFTAEPEDLLCNVTSGTFENDKALFAHSHPLYEYDGPADLKRFLEKNPQYELQDDTYEGGVY